MAFNAINNLARKVQSPTALLKQVDDSDTLAVMTKQTRRSLLGHAPVLRDGSRQGILARMAEWSMSKVVAQPNCFGQILVQAKGSRYVSGNLSYLKRVG